MGAEKTSRPLYIVTYVTPRGRRCWFAIEGEVFPDGTPKPVRVPGHIQSQLEALGARVAWRFHTGPVELCMPGEAASVCDAVRAADGDSVGRLVFG